ncbi:MAG: hypothetical protein M0R32_09110 [Candidatus Cloacimonetes bacterium]|jgi:hypothetical protein|nr:hypothetical protein [Candidatus Cloacimonadota bacterium]
MDFKSHCRECEEKLGKRWDVVHKWLDAFAGRTFPSDFHRIHRHHQAGVEEVRHKWGDEAARAAELHILSDFKCIGLDKVPTVDKVTEMLGMQVIHHPGGMTEYKSRKNEDEQV